MCPWNHKFSREVAEASFAPRSLLAGKDARRLARELLAMLQSEFSVAFRRSPMKRAKARGLRRNAALVLGGVGSGEDVPVLVTALADTEPLVRSHAASARGRIGSPDAIAALVGRIDSETDESVLEALHSAVADVTE